MKLFKPTNESENLIIFIHGFTGSKQTWLDINDNPKPLISFLLDDAYLKTKFHYAVFEYTTSFKSNIPRIFRLINKHTGWKNAGYSLPIKDISNNLITKIEDRFSDYKRIIIIGHSMGGLIGKQLINDLLDKNSKSNIDLFVTLATPHLGEGLASIASILFKNPQLVDFWRTLIHSPTSTWCCQGAFAQIKVNGPSSDKGKMLSFS